MGFILLITKSVLPIFVILGIANIYFRFFKPDIKQLVNLALYVFAPAIVFHVMIKEGIGLSEIGKYLFLMIIVTFSLMIIGYAAGKVLRLNKNDLTLFILSVSMINIGNFGVPLIYFTYGDSVRDISILTFIAFNLPLVTIAIFMASEENSIKGSLKDVFRIPIFHASILALIINELGIRMPETVVKLSGFLGDAAFPFLIFILGLQLSTIKINLNLVKTAMASVIIRLAAAPFISALILIMLNFKGTAFSVALVQISGPSALLPLMYSIKFGRQSDLLASSILLSTAISAVSLPLVIYFSG